MSSARRGGRRSGRWSRISSQLAWAHCAGGLGDVADDGHRAVERAAGEHPQLHRREVLGLVDHDVAVGADLVVLAVGRLRLRGLGPSSARASSSSGTSSLVHTTSSTSLGPRAGAAACHSSSDEQRRRPARRSSAGEPKRSCSSCGRGEHRPHPLERLAHLGRARGAGRAPRRPSTVVAARCGQRGEQLAPRRSGGRRCGCGSGGGRRRRCGRCCSASSVQRLEAEADARGRRAAAARGRGPPWRAPWPCAGRP